MTIKLIDVSLRKNPRGRYRQNQNVILYYPTSCRLNNVSDELLLLLIPSLTKFKILPNNNTKVKRII